ncbi:hypothetical protein [Silanimonas algicola]
MRTDPTAAFAPLPAGFRLPRSVAIAQTGAPQHHDGSTDAGATPWATRLRRCRDVLRARWNC